MVRTGAFAYLKYAYETVFQTAVTANKKFGLQDRVSSWTLTNNRINLAQLNQIEPEAFAYGQQQGSLSVGYVLSNPWVFGSIYGAPSVGSISNGVATHTYPHGSTGQPKTVRSSTVEIAFDAAEGGSNEDIVSFLIFSIISSISATTSDLLSAILLSSNGSFVKSYK